MNGAARRDGRSEGQTYAKLAELNGNHGSASRARTHSRERKFSAGKKACRLAILRQHVGLGEDLEESLYFQRLNGCSQIQIRAEEEEIERIRNGRRERGCALERRESRSRILFRGRRSNGIGRARANDV